MGVHFESFLLLQEDGGRGGESNQVWSLPHNYGMFAKKSFGKKSMICQANNIPSHLRGNCQATCIATVLSCEGPERG